MKRLFKGEAYCLTGFGIKKLFRLTTSNNNIKKNQENNVWEKFYLA
ncbi:MAG: hypothetical protein LBK06_00695 [Planctomycetaceae bacterium]|nr:hypothetical protein [Planctomycetaceae bacterium]